MLSRVSHGRALGTPHHIDDAKVLPCPVTTLTVRADIPVLAGVVLIIHHAEASAFSFSHYKNPKFIIFQFSMS
jgi:hypothetical protein